MQETTLTREQALDRLEKFGIKGPDVYLIDFIPLLEIIWADGKVQEAELAILCEYLKKHINHINNLAGYKVLTYESARTFIGDFLEKAPNPDLMKTLREFIVPLRMSSSASDQTAAKSSLLAACLDIAASSVVAYPYSLNDRFNPAEKRCFFEIVNSFN